MPRPTALVIPAIGVRTRLIRLGVTANGRAAGTRQHGRGRLVHRKPAARRAPGPLSSPATSTPLAGPACSSGCASCGPAILSTSSAATPAWRCSRSPPCSTVLKSEFPTDDGVRPSAQRPAQAHHLRRHLRPGDRPLPEQRHRLRRAPVARGAIASGAAQAPHAAATGLPARDQAARRESPAPRASPRSWIFALTRLPATSRWTVASPSRRWSGPCTQRMLCTFSSGTHVVCRHTRPREATTYRSSPIPAQEVIGQRRLPASSRTVARATGSERTAANELAEHLVRLGPRSDRDDRAQPLALGLVLAALAGAGDINLETAPAERAPDQRLGQPNRLDPARPDRLGGRLDQAGPQPDAIGGSGDRRAVLAVQLPPEVHHRRRAQTAGTARSCWSAR